jgi:hypothetical protein
MKKNNKRTIELVKILAVFFAVVGVIVIFISWIGIFIENGAWDGFKKMQELYSPFNILNYVLTVAVFSPAIVCYFLFEHLKK